MPSGNSVFCAAIDVPSELSSHILPMHEDEMNYYLLVWNDYIVELNNVHPRVSQIANKVTDIIEEILCNTSLTIILGLFSADDSQI